MYETHFKLKERPFAGVPRVDHFFPAASIEAARTALTRTIERAEGAGMVVGPAGTGKTLLCRVLAQQFQDAFRVAVLAGGHLSTRRALLQAILYELGQPYRGLDEGEARLALVDYLTTSEDCPRGVVLLVDEAHALPLRLLDEVRTLTNLARGSEPAVRLVLAGGRMLEERFASPRLESFSQRLAARCYLEPFNRSETQEYIHARIAAAGGPGPRIFPPETCQSVYKATDGFPRLVNQVCDHAMLLALTAGRKQLSTAHIEEAWADLQQLPAPWTEEPKAAKSPSSAIEFGELQDAPGDAEPAASELVSEAHSPALRISPEDEEADDADSSPAEPAEQVSQIQQMLDKVDEEFQPAGSIGPEVELVFDEPEHPFEEPFEQEEVINDRYSPAAKSSGTAAKAEQTGSSLSLTAVAEACRKGAAKPAPAPVATAQDARTVPLHAAEPAEQPEPDDTDMVIIEDGYEDQPPWPVRTVVPVRRQEYGGLFAKLRRG